MSVKYEELFCYTVQLSVDIITKKLEYLQGGNGTFRQLSTEMFYYCMYPNVEVNMVLDIVAIVLIE